MTTTNNRPVGARAAGGEAPSKKKFPWWLLLLALLALALLIWLLTRGGDDAANSGQAGEATQGENAGDAAAGDGAAGGAAGGGTAAGGAAAGAKGQITAGGTTVYPATPGAKLPQFKGDKAEGKGVIVESVVSDEGFWAGDAQDRVFVRLRTGGDESGPQVKAGDRVDFSGNVKPHGEAFAKQLGVEGDEGASELTAQGVHIEVPEVALSDK